MAGDYNTAQFLLLKVIFLLLVYAVAFLIYLNHKCNIHARPQSPAIARSLQILFISNISKSWVKIIYQTWFVHLTLQKCAPVLMLFCNFMFCTGFERRHAKQQHAECDSSPQRDKNVWSQSVPLSRALCQVRGRLSVLPHVRGVLRWQL